MRFLTIFNKAMISVEGHPFHVGGIRTEIPRAYLNRTALKTNMTADPNCFRFTGYYINPVHERYPYKPIRGAPQDTVWPPKGVHLALEFRAPKKLENDPKFKEILVTVHYELYQGIPLLSKWVTISGPQQSKVNVQIIKTKLVNQILFRLEFQS